MYSAGLVKKFEKLQAQIFELLRHADHGVVVVDRINDSQTAILISKEREWLYRQFTIGFEMKCSELRTLVGWTASVIDDYRIDEMPDVFSEAFLKERGDHVLEELIECMEATLTMLQNDVA